MQCRRRKRNAPSSTAVKAEIANSQGPHTAADQAPATAQATGCRAANSLAALAQQGGSTDALLQSLCKSRSNSLALSSSQLLDSEHRHTSGASDQSLVSQPNFRQLLHSAVAPAMTAQQQACSRVYDGTLDFMLPSAEEKPLCQTLAIPQSAPAVPEELVDDPLQDVLDWDLPEPSSTPFNASSFDQAMAFMQDSRLTERTPFQQQMPMPASYTGLSNSPGTLGVTADPAYTGTLAGDPYNGQSNQLPIMLAPQLGDPQQAYSSSFAAVRLSIKLFNSTPAQLPDDLRQQLTGWLNCAPAGVEGYIRPGCVHVTMSATVPSQASDAQPTARHLHGVVARLLDTPQDTVWHNTTMLVQLGDQAAVLHQGQVLKAWTLAANSQAAAQGCVTGPAATTAAAVVTAAAAAAAEEGSVKASCCDSLAGLPSKLPVLQCSQPACLIAGQQQLQTVRLEVQGWSKDCKVVCRAGGRHWEVQMRPLSIREQQQAVEVSCCSTQSEMYPGIMISFHPSQFPM